MFDFLITGFLILTVTAKWIFLKRLLFITLSLKMMIKVSAAMMITTMTIAMTAMMTIMMTNVIVMIAMMILRLLINCKCYIFVTEILMLYILT